LDTLPDDLGRSSPPWYLLIGLPALGGCIVLAARRLLPGDGGHDPLGGLSTKPTPLSGGPGVLLAALGTLPFGAVLGPEAPLIALGSVVALSVTPFVKLGAREQAVLATAGSMSAVSAVFGGPLVAGVLMVDAGVGLGAMLIPMLIPGLVAAAIGYLLFTGLGNWAGIQETLLTVPGLPAYTHERVLDLVVGLGVGIAGSGDGRRSARRSPCRRVREADDGGRAHPRRRRGRRPRADRQGARGELAGCSSAWRRRRAR